MSLGNAARIARRELRGGLRGFRVFLACLALGVAAIAAVGTVRSSIESGLSREGATLLGGDAEIQLTYRFASDQERQWLNERSEALSEIADFRSMIVVGDGPGARRALTQVKAVDDAYPLRGAVRLEPDMPLALALDGSGGLPGAVLDPLLADRLGLAVGGHFKLGEQAFVLMARLLREPDAGGGFTLGPRSIVRLSALGESGLLAPGTLFDSAYRMNLAPQTNLNALRIEAQQMLEGSGMRWRDRRDGAPGVSEFVARLGSFLVLVGLAGLCVGGVGVSAAVAANLDRKVPVIATLRSLGADGRTIFQAYALQIAVLAAVGIAIGLVIGAILPILLSPILLAYLPLPIELGLRPVPLMQAAVYGALTAAVFTLWPLARCADVRAATLFREAALGLTGRPRARYIVLTMALLFLLVALAAWFSGLARLVLYAAGGLLAAFVTLILASWALKRLARLLSGWRPLMRLSRLRRALAAVAGPGNEATSVILALGLGLSVLAAIGQIDTNLRAAIQRDLPEVAPSFFVLDIQPDQLDGFRARLSSDAAVSRVEIAPMLRGVITRIDDRPARAVAGDHWVIRGDRGVTFSDSLPAGTTLTAGQWWPQGYTGTPQISFAAAEAAEMGLSLGQSLTINILGREITGTITGFREVDFSNAGMGFVLAMNSAAVAGAPFSSIATIYASQSAEPAIMGDLSDSYPNITVISVRDAIDRVSGILSAISAAVTYAALAALATGVVVLIGAAAAGERARSYEAAILKTLGSSRLGILTEFLLRSMLLGLAAGLVAIVAGVTAGWAVTTFVMDNDFHVATGSALIIVLGGILLTTASGLALSLRALAARPARILRARE